MTHEAKTFLFPPHGVTCFHCGEVFMTTKAARLHFGNEISDEPGCVMKLSARDNELLWLLREKDAELWRYRQEDQPIMRELYAAGAKHARELRDAEQLGYDRGLKDGQTFLAAQPLPPEIVAKVEAELRSGATERGLGRSLGISHGRIRGVARAMKRRHEGEE